MIEIEYTCGYELRICGHAGQAPIGQDIVCAGVSALICSLAAVMDRHREELLQAEILLESGFGIVKVTPTLAFEKACQSAFETVLCGFEALVSQYPSYISLIKAV